MTREETVKIMEILQVAYPGFYRNASADHLKKAVILWTELFANDDFRTVAAAVKALISVKADSYPPSIGAVKEQIVSLRSTGIDESQAWALVSKACSNGIYHYREEYDKLPPDIQAAVGAPEQLREWAKMDVETVQSVVASNFKKSFRNAQARKKNNEMLPAELRLQIGAIADRMMIGNGGDSIV